MEFLQLREECLSNQRGVDYDPDSSPKSWKYYSHSYEHHYRLFSKFSFKNPEYAKWENFSYVNKLDENVPYQRLYVFADEGDVFESAPHVFRLGGETDWDFKEDSNRRKNKFGKLSKFIKNDHVKKRLVECKRMHHTLLNFSIMPATGNMQGIKSEGYGDWLDRFDSFASIIDDYYQKKNELLLSKSKANQNSLVSYLSNFKGVDDYFNQHYFIDNTDFIQRLVLSGKSDLNNEEHVKRYISLAEEYWNLKESYLQQQ